MQESLLVASPWQGVFSIIYLMRLVPVFNVWVNQALVYGMKGQRS